MTRSSRVVKDADLLRLLTARDVKPEDFLKYLMTMIQPQKGLWTLMALDDPRWPSMTRDPLSLTEPLWLWYMDALLCVKPNKLSLVRGWHGMKDDNSRPVVKAVRSVLCNYLKTMWCNSLARLQQWPFYLQGPGFKSHLRPAEFFACHKVSPLNNRIPKPTSVPCALII